MLGRKFPECTVPTMPFAPFIKQEAKTWSLTLELVILRSKLNSTQRTTAWLPVHSFRGRQLVNHSRCGLNYSIDNFLRTRSSWAANLRLLSEPLKWHIVSEMVPVYLLHKKIRQKESNQCSHLKLIGLKINDRGQAPLWPRLVRWNSCPDTAKLGELKKCIFL